MDTYKTSYEQRKMMGIDSKENSKEVLKDIENDLEQMIEQYDGGWKPTLQKAWNTLWGSGRKLNGEHYMMIQDYLKHLTILATSPEVRKDEELRKEITNLNSRIINYAGNFENVDKRRLSRERVSAGPGVYEVLNDY